MKKWILLLVFPLLGMPAFAQQKKNPSGKKKKPVKTETVQENIVEPPPPEPGPVERSMPGTGTADARPSVAEEIFTAVEQMPEFPGGIAAMRHFLAEHIQYPELARKENIQGMVFLQFVVSRTGQIRDVIIKRDIGAGCGKEAVRVVNSMPLWKPGRQNGQLVNVSYTLPVAFRLGEHVPVEKKEQE